MLKDFFHETIQLQPSFRSFIGDYSANDDFENIASTEYKEKYKKIIYKYKNILDKERKTLNLDTLTLSWIVENQINLLQHKDEWMYITSHSNPILEFIVDDTYMYPLKTSRDVSNLISRIHKRIPFIKDVMKAMQDGTKEDLTIPKMICKHVIKQIQTILKNQSYYIKFPKHLDKQKEEYIRVVDTEYVPILYELLKFLKTYVKSCRDSIGLCYINNGKQIYIDIIKDYTTLDITPEEVFQFGKTELKTLYKEFKIMKPDIMSSFGLKIKTRLTNKELFEKIRDMNSEYFNTSNDIINAYKLSQEKIRKHVIQKHFYYNVKRYNIKKIPTLIENSSTTAYYYPPAIKSKRQGTVFINTRFLKANPKYTVDILSLHEGIPGHHYQYQYMKQKRFPLYRIYGGDNDAFTEGWALYCESFLESNDPKLKFGRWIYSMLRTVRLIVDTGVHYYGWSYKRALQFMIRHIPLTIEELKMELERYICDPGQAVSYKIGEHFFLKERDEYIKQNRGTIKDFHKEILDCGPLPLNVLQEKLRHRLICNR